MENTRTSAWDNAMTWVELTYSSLRLDTYAVFGVLSMVVLLLCAGAYQEAVRQAHVALHLTAPQDPGVMQMVDLVNQYGLALLVGLCYFSNVTDSGTRRELIVDAISIATGILVPQLVFHATFVWSLQRVVEANNLMVNSAAVQALNGEWLFVWGLSMGLMGLAMIAWRSIHRPHRRPAR